MVLDDKQLVKIAAEMKGTVLALLAADVNAPEHAVAMARIHLEKPWVPGFLTSLVSPLASTFRSHLHISLLRIQGRVWYIPSHNWWRGHARQAHPMDGSGFDLAAHLRLYTEQSEKSQTLYADLMQDGTIHLLGEEDFKVEADYWRNTFKTE